MWLAAAPALAHEPGTTAIEVQVGTDTVTAQLDIPVGHSITLVASALGWLTLPSRPVEILAAVSVAVAAIHVLRPFAVRGEEAIAGAFGPVSYTPLTLPPKRPAFIVVAAAAVTNTPRTYTLSHNT